MSDTKLITLRASAATTVATTEYGGTTLDALATGTCTGTTASKLEDTAAGFVAAGVAVGDIAHNITDGTYALVTVIDSATVLTLASDIMDTAKEYEVISGKGYKLNDVYHQLQALLDVTAAADGSNDTLDVYLDTSPDGGLTWLNIGHFTQVLGDGGAKKFVMAVGADNPGTSAVTDVTSSANAGATRQFGFNDRFRYRATSAVTGTASFTWSLKVFLKK